MLYPDSYPSLERILSRRMILDVELLSEDVATKYYDTLMLHITYVQEAGAKLGVHKFQLEEHDLSKFTLSEFNAYARHFHGGGAPDQFALAWLHHLHFNQHHWEHWMFPNGWTPKNSNVIAGMIEMPERFVLEMIADWTGSSKTYTGSEDMTDWLIANLSRISVHPKTGVFLREKLSELGYADVIHQYPLKSEVLLASHNL